MVLEAFYGILIPFLGTSLGAACVFFLKKTLSDAFLEATGKRRRAKKK